MSRKESPEADSSKERLKGEVKFYNQDRNYGFIIPEDGGEDVYFQGRNVKKGWLEGGETVEFERIQGRKGPRAKNVRKVESWWSKKKIIGILLIFGVLFVFARTQMIKRSNEIQVSKFTVSSENIRKNGSIIASTKLRYGGEIEDPVINFMQKHSPFWNIFNKLLIKNRTLNLKIDGEPRGKKKVSLGFGENKNISFRIKMSEAGTHLLAIENHLCNIQVLKPATFITENLTISSEKIGKGDNLLVSLDTKNIGDLEGSKKLKIYMDGDILSKKQIDLSPDETKTTRFKLTIEKLGEHKLSVDNLSTDLDVVKLKTVVEKLKVQPEEVLPKENATVTASIRNKDNIAGEKTVSLRIDGRVEKTRKVFLSPNETKDVTFKVQREKPENYRIEIQNASETFKVLKPPTFEYSDLSISEKKIYLGETVKVAVKVKNTGGVEGEKRVELYLNGNIEKEKKIVLNPKESRKLRFTITKNVAENYSIKIGNLSAQFEIINPRKNPLQHLDYYYGTAESYVQKKYQVPEEKTIQGLANFLEQVKLPVYKENYFDCSESSSIIEWLLEGAGFNAYLASNHSLGERVVGPHDWILAELESGEKVAVEATRLTKGDIYTPPGIIIAPNGSFKKYSWRYKRFQNWKEKHPPSLYDYDPNMTLEEWESQYLEPVIQPIGIPTRSGYYSPVATYESPKIPAEGKTMITTHYYVPESEYDWWNVPPYSQTSPFSKWE